MMQEIKTYIAFGKNHCTQHRIDYDTLYSHVLRKIRECAKAALMDGEAVADRLTNTCEAEQREQREAMERSLTRDEERIEILDKMVSVGILTERLRTFFYILVMR